jgi:hypothetical protein
VKTCIRVVLGVLAGSLAVVPAAGAATSPFVKLPTKWRQSPVVEATLLGNTAFVASASYGANFGLGFATKLTTGKVRNGKLALTGGKSLGYTAALSGGGPVFVGSSLFLERQDTTLQVVPLSASGKVGAPKASPTAGTAGGVLTGGVQSGSRPVLAFTQGGFGVCCSTAGAPSSLVSLSTYYPTIDVAIGIDRHRNVRVAWLDYNDAGSAVRTVGLDPSTLLPETATSTVLLGPKQIDSTTFSIAVACGAVCRVVYGDGLNLNSWAPGDSRPRKIVGQVNLLAGASVDRKGHLLTAYVKGGKLVVRRGDARGKGGKTTSAVIPAGNLSSPVASFTSSRVLVAMAEQFGGTYQTVAGVLPLP